MRVRGWRVAADHNRGGAAEQTSGRRNTSNAPFILRADDPAMSSLRVVARLLPLLLLAACVEPAGAFLGASAAALPVFGRTVPDIAVSAVTGKDCSLVRLEQGKAYCKPVEPPPAPPPVCTRSLGTVDCWANPDVFGPGLTEVADGPRTLTPAQEANRTRRWPP